MFYTVTSVLQLRHDNVLVVGGSKLGQNPGSGSGSKFNVFGSTTLLYTVQCTIQHIKT